MDKDTLTRIELNLINIGVALRRICRMLPSEHNARDTLQVTETLLERVSAEIFPGA